MDSFEFIDPFLHDGVKNGVAIDADEAGRTRRAADRLPHLTITSERSVAKMSDELVVFIEKNDLRNTRSTA